MAWILFLSVTGIILICLELFLPGMVAGVVGFLCLAGAVGATYFHYGAMAGNVALGGLLVLSVVLMLLWLRVFPRLPGARNMITERDLSTSKSADSLARLAGKSGRALTALRPSGAAEIEGARVDVVAETGWIEEGATVRVMAVEGNRVVVRRV